MVWTIYRVCALPAMQARLRANQLFVEGVLVNSPRVAGLCDEGVGG